MKDSTNYNPFINRNKVTDPNEFFGRDDAIQYIVDKVTYCEPQSVAVIGERRSGKSSLLTHLYQLLTKRAGKLEIPDKLLCIFLDPEELVIDDPDGYTWVIIDELISEYPNLLSYLHERPIDDKNKILPSRRPQIILKHLLDQTCIDGYRFIFFIDEFELLACNQKLNQVCYLDYLRGLADNYKLAYITASRIPFYDIKTALSRSGSPFDNNFSQPVLLGLLTNKECYDLINGSIKGIPDASTAFSKAGKARIIEYAGKNPYYLKVACSHYFDWGVSKKALPNSNWEESFYKEASEEFKRLWGSLKPEESDWILRAQMPKSIGVEQAGISKSLQSLVDRGLLEEVDGFYRPFSDAFSQYIEKYVEAIEKDYQANERYIQEGYLKFEPAEVQKILNHLSKLNKEWQKRSEGISLEENLYERSKILEHILTRLHKFLNDMHDFEEIRFSEAMKVEAYRKAAEESLDELIGVFHKREWFGKNEISKLDRGMGKRILDQLAIYLEERKLERVFNNGYDKVLNMRITFMKDHGVYNFKNFPAEFEKTFDRLAEVYDYQRARDILQPNSAGIFRFIGERYIYHPLCTAAAIILLPFASIGLVQIWFISSNYATFPHDKIPVSIRIVEWVNL